MRKRKDLSARTRGTKTYHFPFDRTKNDGVMTMLVKQTEDGTFVAGLSVCSANDQFEKFDGRVRALSRMEGAPLTASNGEQMFEQVISHLNSLELYPENNPLRNPEVEPDLSTICYNLEKIFEAKKARDLANAARKVMSESDLAECCLTNSCELSG